MTFNYQDGDDYGKYSDNVDGDNELCDQVQDISNIFNHQLLKECGITRHLEAKINLEKNSKKSLLITMLCPADQWYIQQTFIILHLQTFKF